MSDITVAQRNALLAWSGQAIEAGWLPETAPQALDDTTLAAPNELFDQAHRPLVVGLFGGTGAGKSSLLNRLAGQSVARASAERPTSRDITVYVHRSVSVDKLPDYLPLNRIRTTIHNNETYRQIMFVDMPDFDSVELQNRDLVELWLPHIDVLLYVVNPERYRDDQGWRLLQRHAKEHAWLFIMNHWDKGSEQQLEDFKNLLQAFGLSDPALFRTDCSLNALKSAYGEHSDYQANDDFDALQNILTDLANESIIKALQQHGVLARLDAMKSLSDQWLSAMDREDSLATLPDGWSSYWQLKSDTLRESMSWSFAQQAASHAQPDPFLWRLLRKRSTAPVEASLTTDLAASINERMDNLVDDFINRSAQEHALPVAAMKKSVDGHYKKNRKSTPRLLQESVSRSLIHPGKPWQQRLDTVLNALCWLLPLAAAGWIGWRVVSAFIDGGSNPAAYLGSNFAVNGFLLLLFAWLVPAVLHAKLIPTREQAALQGLNEGLEDALEQTRASVNASLGSLKQQKQQLLNEYHHLWTQLPDITDREVPEQVKRLIIDQISQPGSRSLDVRARAQSSTDRAPVS